MAVKGICKARNEQHIIGDTLDNWAPICDAGIHVYLDHSTDATADICHAHPAVVEVLQSDLLDPDRERAEFFNRQQVLNSARRFIGERDWVAYFDADEHVFDFNPIMLQIPILRCVCVPMFETYITPEDAHLSEYEYKSRRWCGDEWEYSPMLYRNTQFIGFTQPDQRNMDIGPPLHQKEKAMTGASRHWGKGLSVSKWEEKCRYYGDVFGPKYADKWRRRMGKAVHTASDFGRPLVLWEDIRTGKVPTIWRREMELVS